jgi:hypothetical protein
MRSDFKFRIHNHSEFSGVKTALALDQQVCVNSSSRIRELRSFKYNEKPRKTQNFLST